MLKRTLYCLLPPLLAVLGGCGDPQDIHAPEAHPEEAYTWKEWVARETPKRPEFVSSYHEDKGLPNMEKWRPEDFLPDEYLKADHVDICTLPQAERQKIRPMMGDSNNVTASMREKLAYAKKGVIGAQAGMGWYCHANTLRVQGDPSLGLTTADALEWARRGAASGDPEAIYRLADCMFRMKTDIAVGDVDGRLDPFWADQMLYWLWKAADDVLEPDAVGMLRPGGLADYGHPSPQDNAVQRYKWARLLELQAIFRRFPYGFGRDFIDRTMRGATSELTDEQRRLGDVAVAAWLKAHPDIWGRIARRPVTTRDAEVLCRGEPGHLAGFDLDGLNRELARYGLSAPPLPN